MLTATFAIKHKTPKSILPPHHTFVQGSYQTKFMIIVVDYFTKWIEAEVLARITSHNILCFYKQNMLV